MFCSQVHRPRRTIRMTRVVRVRPLRIGCSFSPHLTLGSCEGYIVDEKSMESGKGQPGERQKKARKATDMRPWLVAMLVTLSSCEYLGVARGLHRVL
jgi:hypothetical protein